MPTVLITGANRGIGLEFARQYAAEDWRVIATCRDPASADDLKAISGDIDVRSLDVNDTAAIRALADALDGQAIDLLLLNVRVPEERRGDHYAQIAACRLGHRRLLEVVRAHSLAEVRTAFDEIISRTERRMRAGIEQIPDVFVAQMIALKSRELFEATEEDRKDVEISFS